MSRHGDVTLSWADGEYQFRLGWKELAQVQEACDAGPLWVISRLNDGTWRLADLEAPILHGLLGAGMDAAKARKLVQTWVRERPAFESVLTAQAILSVAVYGMPEDPPGKSGAATGESGRLSPEASSGSPPSMS